MADYCPREYRCQRRQGHDGGVSLFVEEESCDAVVIDLRGNYPPEENGFGAGESVVCTYSNTGRLCSKCQQPSRLCMVRALYSWDAMLARIRWCRLDKPSIPVSLTISVHCCFKLRLSCYFERLSTPDVLLLPCRIWPSEKCGGGGWR